MELRYFDLTEIRADEADGQKTIKGLIPYQSKSVDLGGFVEEIMPGAFARSLREADQVALWSHDTSRPLGRKSRGTLSLSESKRGLHIEISPPDTTWGRDAYESIRRGDVNQMSFGFNVPEGGDTWREWGGRVIRSLLDVDLHEVSPVAFGAYPGSQSAVRTMYGDVPEIPFDKLRATPFDKLRATPFDKLRATPAELRGATDSADEEGQLQAQRAKRDRTIAIEWIGA